MKKVILLFFWFCLAVGLAQSQSKVTGRVTDVADGSAMPFVTVAIKGASTGATTDVDGNYTITAPTDATLIFSFVGYKSIEQAIAGRSVLNMSLESEASKLDEVLVVGYGTQRKRDITSSVARVGGKDIAQLATPSFDQQLAGRAAGVQVVVPSGTLGAAPIFRIRGINSLSSSTSPLFIVDGIPVTLGDVGVGYAANNAMGDINPADIESINILKDGAATAIYGSRASNGVVLITTKKGTIDKTSLTYTSFMGIARPGKLFKLLDGQQFTDIANELYANNGADSPARYDGTNTNWNDYIYRTGFQHSHTLAASGGSAKSQYYFSVGYTNQEGVIIANNLRRFTAKADLTTQPIKGLKFGATINASNQKYKGIVEGSNSLNDVVFSGVRMLPNVSVFNPDDITGYNVDATDRKALGRGANLITISNGMTNIKWLLDNNANTSETYRAIANTFLEVSPVKGLSIKSLIGADIMLQDDSYSWSPDSGDGFSYGGLFVRYFTPSIRWNWQNIVSYNFVLDDAHNFDLTAVQEYNKYSYRRFGASGDNFSDKMFLDDFISGTFNFRTITGDKQANGMASYLLRANYNYQGKYYLGASLRRDGLSKLPVANRWGTFYGVSAAWRLSKEEFWSSMHDVINDFRLRGSFATVGNQGINGNYPSLGTFSPIRYGSQSGLYFSNMGNDALKWETQQTLDIGFDMQILNNRLSLEFAYWQKNNSDIVLDTPLDPSIGIPKNKITKNVGQINNNGLEFTLGASVIEKEKFRWRADLNFSTQNNKVIKLVDGDINGKFTTIREGYSMNTLWGYDYAGVNKVNGNPMWYKADGQIAQYDIANNKTVLYDPTNPTDISKSTSLNANDKILLGNTIPKWFGGFNNVFTYGNFDLTMFFNFSGGNKIMNATKQSNLLNLDFANKGVEILDRWQSEENPGDGQTPKLRLGYNNQINKNDETNSRFVENGSFLKLNNLMLGYTMPKDMIRKIGLSNVRMYISGQNLFTITSYSGLDPELSSNAADSNDVLTDRFGVDYGAKAMQRTFIFGLSLGF